MKIGTDTTAALSEWCLAYLINYPDWQEKIFQELDVVTGQNSRKVNLSDQESAHLTNAFIEEVNGLYFRNFCSTGKYV
jgi:cytochrome P450